MKFSDKLSLLRRNTGYTQEQLADILSVSRQAVAKWESGQSYPDIANLIQISEHFHVTVDYLVKDESCQNTPEILKLEYNDITTFLIEAKKHTYAAKGAKAPQIRPGSHDYEYQDQRYRYIDTFYGGKAFSGEEVVWMDEVPIYAMNYSGRVLKDTFSGDFLRAALLRVPLDKPFRGPHIYEEHGTIYQCNISGNLSWFQGYEEIHFKGEKIYECYFHGGMIV